MKKTVVEFIRRGLIAGGFGPVVLAVMYMVLQRCGLVDTVSVRELCTGIFSLTALAFVAGGTNVVYQMERLPLMLAIFIHGGVLYISYLAVYLINGWMKWGTAPILVYTIIFVIGYIFIWIIIYSVTKRKTARLNALLEEKKQGPEKNL